MSYHHPRAAIIASYRSRPQPYSDHLLNLAALAVQLRNLKDDTWTLEEETCSHYVYVFLDPRKPGAYEYRCPSGKVVCFRYQPYYVGKGKDARAFSHFKRDELQKKSHKNHTIKAIRDAGFNPKKYVVVTPSRKTDWLAQALEIDLIFGIGRRDVKTGPLTNMTQGGDGAAGLRHTEEARLKMSIASKAATRTPHSEKTKRRIGQAHRGKTLSAEHLQILRETNTGRKMSRRTREALRCANEGRRHTEETKALISRKKLGAVSTKRINLVLRELPSGQKWRSEAHGRNAPILIDGIPYRSMAEASRQLGIPSGTISARVRSPHIANYSYS